MRRWLTTMALVGAVTAALTGCMRPDGVDGDLTDDWQVIGQPKIFTPQAGVCLPEEQPLGYLGIQPVDCSMGHLPEIFFVGQLSGPDADRTTPPPAGSPAVRNARAACDREAATFLGGDWRTARLRMTVVFPSPAGWKGGARWFQCDISEEDNLDDRNLVSREGSLRDALKAADSPLAHRCFKPKFAGDKLERVDPVACTAKHRAEFVGAYTAPDTSFDAFDNNPEAAHKSCLALVARYAKVPNNRELTYRLGTIFYNPSEDEWEDGERGIQCFAWFDGTDMTRSIRGAGLKGLPAA